MPAVNYSQSYGNTLPQESMPKKQTFKTNVVKKTRPQKNKKVSVQQQITTVNFALLSVCGFFTIVFIAIYSIVALNETEVANLHSKIHELNYENVELENKLENIKSFYSVDTKVASSTTFEKAKKVLELNHLDAKEVYHALPNKNHLNTVTGF